MKPTCINHAAIEGLRRHLRPRSIHVVTVTARQCAAFASWGSDVICHVQVRTVRDLERMGKLVPLAGLPPGGPL